MNMATIERPKAPETRSKNTVVCRNPYCCAEYSRDTKWVRGYNSNPPGDTGNERFVAVSIVPDGCCPVCLTPNRLANRRRLLYRLRPC